MEKAWSKYNQGIIKAIAFPLLILAFFTIYGAVRFGSMAKTLASLRGESLWVDEESKRMTIKAGDPLTINYDVSNLSNAKISIIGANMSCSCTSAQDLPMTILAAETRTIRINVTVPEEENDFSGTVRLFSDDPRQPTLDLSFTIHVIGKKGGKVQTSANGS